MKIDLKELRVGDDKKVLEQLSAKPAKPEKTKKDVRKADEEKLTAQIKINLKPSEKEQLMKIAKHNISAFVREALILGGYFK